MPHAPAAALAVTDEERRELLKFAGLRSVPQSVALRARIVLGAADGVGNKVLARQLATSLPTVLLWRGRYQAEGLLGILEDRPRSGRPKEITPEQEAALIDMTLHSSPKSATHWSVRLMAREQGVSPATVQRIWKKHHLQPHRVAQCRVEDPPCGHSRALAAMAVAAAKQGKSEAEIHQVLEGSNLVKAARQRNRILWDPVVIPIAGAPFKGPAKAKIAIVEFSDFQCPFCAMAVGKLNELLWAYPRDV